MTPALRARLDVARPQLAAATRAFWSAPDLGERYGDYLCTMHGVLRATTDLLELAAERCARLAAGHAADPVAAPLREYLTAHAAEERDHDGWLLEDLAAYGADPARALSQAPSPLVARMTGAQYYWIRHFHPVCLLGYMAVLEGNPPAAELADVVVARAGLPAGAVRTLRAHAELDPGHRTQLDALLGRLPLTAALEAAVTLSALHTTTAATAMFADLASRTPRMPRERRDAR